MASMTLVLAMLLLLGSMRYTADQLPERVRNHDVMLQERQSLVQHVVHSGTVSTQRALPSPPDRPYVPSRPAGPVDFAQVGFVYDDAKSVRAPLYGRPAPRNPARWQYFMRMDDMDVRVGVKRGGRASMTDTGCEELQDGDVVEAPEVMNGPGNVHIYDRLMD